MYFRTFPNFELLFIVIVITLFSLFQGSHCQRKLVCLDSKSDVDSAGWKFNTGIKSVDNAGALPKAFGDLKSLQGNGVWYVEGPSSGSAKEVTFKSADSVYTTKAKSVQIYVKYYDNSPRRVSLFPVKSSAGSSGGPLLLLPVSTPGKWTEIRQEIDPSDSPIEFTAYLSANQYILFEKIIVAVDSPLPSDLSSTCQAITSLPNLSVTQPPWATSGTRKPILGSGGSKPTTPSTLSDTARSDCPALPPVPECKCNCLCNCANNKC